jgi:hypothetical protein
MKRIFLLISVFLLIQATVFAQSLKQVQQTRIYFGPGKQEVGIEKGGGEHWKPLFFSVDEDGVIHIPDFYKMRIVLFNGDGSYKGENKCPAGISPRMNYFSLARDGFYVTFNDSSLYLLNDDGSVKWEHKFGLGIIPQRVFPNAMAIFLLLPALADSDGRSLVFDYSSADPIGRFGIKTEDMSVPLIQIENGLNFCFNLNSMQTLNEYAADAFKEVEDAHLIFVDKNGKSVWKRKNQASETVLVFNNKGKLLYKNTIYYPVGVSGTGFWTFADEDLLIYKNYFYDDYMEIVAYRFKD